jgi:hypothetical protein
MSKLIKATYVSVWDGGIEISTECFYNPDTNDVTDIESSDVDGVEFLEREYIILPDGTEIEREDFTIEGEESE